MAKFETLEADIKKMLAGEYASESLEYSTDTAHNVLKLAKNVATHTLDMVNHKPRMFKSASDRSIRMSEIGEPCVRKLMYKWYKPELGVYPYAEHSEPFLPVKFTFGDYIEELTLFLASEAGHTVSDRQAEYTLKVIGTPWYAIGHIDAKIDGVVVDVKSAADGSFNKYKREGLTDANDSFGYRWQIDSYAVAACTSERAFLFTNKHDGNLHIIDRTTEDLLNVPNRIHLIGQIAEGSLSGKQTPRLLTKLSKHGEELPTVCSYCSFKYTCYDGDIKGVIVSGRPKYFVESTLTKEGHDYIKDKAQVAKPPGVT
jgi:hypothetical protein